MSTTKKNRTVSLPAGTETAALADPMAGLFSDNFQIPKDAEIRSMSPMVRPNDFPAGRKLVGKLTKVFGTEPASDKKGCGIEIIPLGHQVGIALPVVTTLARALAFDDVEKGDKAVTPYLGRFVVIEKMPNKIPSKKGQDAWNFIVAILPADFDGNPQPTISEGGE